MTESKAELKQYAERLCVLLAKTDGKKLSDGFYDGVRFANQMLSGKAKYNPEALGAILDTLEAMNI